MSIHPLRRALRAIAAIGVGLGVVVASAGAAAADHDDDERREVGAVYTATNSPAGNQVVAFGRWSDGTLTAPVAYSTGGTGTGAGLGSQGSVTLTDDGRHLLVVNAGSDDVSAFRVRPSGLELIDRVASGGDQPTSVTAHRGVVYVLNAGSGNVAGFRLDRHGFDSMAAATYALSTATGAPGQVSFTPDGDHVIVALRAANAYDVFSVRRGGSLGARVTTPSAGTTPFGFDFDRRDRLVGSNANAGVALGSSASSYEVRRDGRLRTISGPVPTMQSAACWLAVTRDGRFAYTTNAGSASISGYRIDRSGRLSLLAAVSAATGTGPVDLALSQDSRFLYNVNGGSDTLTMFAVGRDGSLTSIGAMPGVPSTALGIAAS
jgi:6-phosphogluconolactonase (cycloisomerase 2 family)